MLDHRQAFRHGRTEPWPPPKNDDAARGSGADRRLEGKPEDPLSLPERLADSHRRDRAGERGASRSGAAEREEIRCTKKIGTARRPRAVPSVILQLP
jgi:hypothetical protein